MNALDLSKYIISKCYNDENPISNLQLQKILYFLYGHFYSHYSKSIFGDDFVAWRFGPVVKDVYFEFNKYISDPITENFDVDLSSEFNTEEVRFINNEIETLAHESTWELVKKSHSTSPWKETFCDGYGEGHTIPKYKINKYFFEQEL